MNQCLEAPAYGQLSSTISRLIHIVFHALVGLSCFVDCRSVFVLAGEQEVSHDTSSIFEIELAVTGKLKFPV
ncbi:MAG: hypothetical protein P8J43_06510, partial [Pirellulales bacterium]|nr:hypothetical protein [Pirellulales bacterium]